jgi:Na+-driven multidrug efflux pump
MKLAVPTVFGQIILVIYNMADTFFIGLTGSDIKLTAVTVCMPAFMFLSAISNLFGVGGASEVSRSLGRRELRRAGDAAAFAVWGCVGMTLLYSLGAWVLLDPYVNILGGFHVGVHQLARGYLISTVVLGGIGTSMNALLAHLVRSEGRSSQASIGIMMGGILNMLLDPLFMFRLLPPGNEVLGAGIATGLSNFIAMLYFVVILYKNRRASALRFRPTKRLLDRDLALTIFSTGLPACIMTLFENISYALLDRLMASNGTSVQAGIGVAKKVNMLAHCIVRGMTQGVLPLIAYNYAARNYKRMHAVVRLSVSISVFLAGLCMAACLAFSYELVGVFIQHGGDSLYYGARFLRILCVGGPFSACAYTFISFFQAVGSGGRSFILAILRKGILDMPLMLVLTRVWPAYGTVWATPITDVVCCAVAIVLFRIFITRAHASMPGYDN